MLQLRCEQFFVLFLGRVLFNRRQFRSSHGLLLRLLVLSLFEVASALRALLFLAMAVPADVLSDSKVVLVRRVALAEHAVALVEIQRLQLRQLHRAPDALHLRLDHLLFQRADAHPLLHFVPLCLVAQRVQFLHFAAQPLQLSLHFLRQNALQLHFVGRQRRQHRLLRLLHGQKGRVRRVHLLQPRFEHFPLRRQSRQQLRVRLLLLVDRRQVLLALCLPFIASLQQFGPLAHILRVVRGVALLHCVAHLHGDVGRNLNEFVWFDVPIDVVVDHLLELQARPGYS